MHITMINFQTGIAKNVKVGFSWTVFFFGFWPTIFRKDWKYFGIYILGSFLTGLATFWAAYMGTVIFQLIFCFKYNKLYTRELVEKGYLPSSQGSKEILMNREYITDNINVYK